MGEYGVFAGRDLLDHQDAGLLGIPLGAGDALDLSVNGDLRAGRRGDHLEAPEHALQLERLRRVAAVHELDRARQRRVAGKLHADLVRAGSGRGNRHGRLPLVVLVEEDLRLFGFGHHGETRGAALHLHRERLPLARRHADRPLRVLVTVEPEGQHRAAAGDHDLHGRHAPVDAVHEHGGAGGFGRAVDQPRIQHQLLVADERRAVGRANLHAFLLVPVERQFERVGGTARQRRDEQRRGAQGTSAARHGGAGGFRLHEHEPAFGFEVDGLRHEVLRLVQPHVRVEGPVKRRLHAQPVASRFKRRHGTRRDALQRAAQRAVHKHLRAFRLPRHVQAHRQGLRPRQRRHGNRQQRTVQQLSVHRSTTFHRLAFIRASTSSNLREAS